MEKMMIRKATANDLDNILKLFKETIETVNVKDYSADQVRVWSDGVLKKEKWLEKIIQQYFLLAFINTSLAGFASITGTGYLDFMYVSRDHQKMGVARCLYDELEKFAIANHIGTIISDVSITAKPFFEKQGFRVIRQQQVAIDGIQLTNYKMEKHLLTANA